MAEHRYISKVRYDNFGVPVWRRRAVIEGRSQVWLWRRHLRRRRIPLVRCAWSVVVQWAGRVHDVLLCWLSTWQVRPRPTTDTALTHQGSIHSHLTIRQVSECFTERVVSVWNGLPGDRTDFSSLVHFKNSILACDMWYVTLLCLPTLEILLWKLDNE